MAIVRQEITINAQPMSVWSLLGDVSKWPSWHPHITEGRMLGGDQFFPGATFQYVYDGESQTGTITQIERPRTLSWRVGNSHQTIHLEPDGEKTQVRGERAVSGFMASLRKGKTEKEAMDQCQAWLNGLKEAAEKA